MHPNYIGTHRKIHSLTQDQANISIKKEIQDVQKIKHERKNNSKMLTEGIMTFD